MRGNNIPGNDGYYSKNKATCPDNVRFSGNEKFPKKILVWFAISERGISKPLIRPSKSEAINYNIYINESLEKRLIPFIQNYLPDSNYIFWPYLASSHCSYVTRAWMDKNVKYV